MNLQDPTDAMEQSHAQDEWEAYDYYYRNKGFQRDWQRLDKEEEE